MNKISFLIIIVLIFSFLSGCQQKAKEEQASITSTSEIVLDQTGAPLTTESIQSVQVQTTQPQASQDLGVTQTITSTSQEATTASSTFEKPSAEQIQQALKNAGLYDGAIDGIIGPKTKKAIEDFQAQNNLVVDGKVGPKTWQKLQSYLNQEPTISSSGISD